MQNTSLPRLSFGFALLIILVLSNVGLYLWEPAPLVVLRNNTFDYFQRLKPRVYQEVPVKIIDIDDESLKRLGQWPWPRTQIAQLISTLQTSKPAAIALDIIFAERDRTSPNVMSELWQLSANERQWLSHLPDHDQALAESLGKSQSVLGFTLNQATTTEAPKLNAHFIQIGHSILSFLPIFSGAINPLPMLEAVAKGSGALTFVPDSDGIIRKVPVALRYQDQIVPTLFTESIRLAQNTDNYLLRSHENKAMGLAEVQIGNIRIPTTENGEMWLYYSQPNDHRYIPAWRVLAGQIAPEQLNGNILLLGTSAPGIMDLRFNALGNIIPGIEIHAQALEQIFSNTQLTRPAWHTGVEVLLLVVGSLFVGSIALRHNIMLSFSVFIITLIGLWSISWHAFVTYLLLVDSMAPSVGLFLVFLYASIFRHFRSERHQRWIKDAFSRYISPNLVEYLISHPQELELGGHRQICSFVFTDLTDFTALMEGLDPSNVVNLLNEYLENLISIAFSHEGTLDRIVGDSVAIMFSAPIKQDDHQRRAVECALDMQAFAEQFSRYLNKQGITFGQTRIGVHTGQVIVGNVGGKAIYDYRALGDPVNTASRLESANKYLGTLICVSETTLEACPDIPARPIGHLLVKGKAIPLKVFEPIACKKVDETAIADYKAAYNLMRDKCPDATATFQQIVAKDPSDQLANFHLQRLLNGERGDFIKLNQK